MKEIIKKNIGFVLKKQRSDSGLSIEDVIDKLKEYDIDIKPKTLYGYENNVSTPNADIFLALCKIYKCQNVMSIFSDSTNEVLFTNKEWKMVEKYRFISTHSKNGANMVDAVLDREYSIAKTLEEKDSRIAELETSSATIIELPTQSGARHLAEYFHDASAGGGIFILGNEDASKIVVPDSDWDERTDYVIRVNGDSMEPDYLDGDNVMVSQHIELGHGDIGIFVVNGKAYIKEYGETELISRNPNFSNIAIHESDNIVCMGKVIGKLEGEYEIVVD